MSRGLGIRQRAFLAGAIEIERRHDARGGCIPLSMIVRSVWSAGAAAEAASAAQKRRERENETDAAWRVREAAWRADTEARAADGDRAAASVLREVEIADELAAFVRDWPFQERPSGGSPSLRPDRDAERLLNPSRVAAELARRGLVERVTSKRGHGVALVRVTERGHEEAGRLEIGTHPEESSGRMSR